MARLRAAVMVDDRKQIVAENCRPTVAASRLRSCSPIARAIEQRERRRCCSGDGGGGGYADGSATVSAVVRSDAAARVLAFAVGGCVGRKIDLFGKTNDAEDFFPPIERRVFKPFELQRERAFVLSLNAASKLLFLALKATILQHVQAIF